jgi:hypothetical protein
MSAIVHLSEMTTPASEAMKDDEDGGGRDDRDDIGSIDGCWRRRKTAEYNILGEVGCNVSSQQPQNWMAGTPSAGGVFLHIHKFAKMQKEGGTSGTQNVRFCNLRICGSLAPKKRMENSQMRNSQIAIAEIWDTLLEKLLKKSRVCTISLELEGRHYWSLPKILFVFVNHKHLFVICVCDSHNYFVPKIILRVQFVIGVCAHRVNLSVVCALTV